MSKPFTFGVELEFNVDYLAGQPVPPSERKTVVFPVLRSEMSINEQFLRQERVIAHLRNTIATASFKIDSKRCGKANIDNWDVKVDTSIRGTDDEELKDYLVPEQNTNKYDEASSTEEMVHNPASFSDQESYIDSNSDLDEGVTYNKIGIEVVSPALVFNERSLDQISRMCILLNSTYRITTNNTCGLHVHLGHHSQGFPLADLKRIMVFLFTFEPQISSLHPLHRYSQYHCYAMRHNCEFTYRHQQQYNRLPMISEYASSAFACKKRQMWFQQAKDHDFAKNSTYNILGVCEDAPKNGVIEDDMYRQTIEFRQHEGTVDGERIAQWIRTIVGIATYVESGHPSHFIELTTAAWEAEKWEKMGDGQDVRREAEMGAALADFGFTIVDLLHEIGLKEQAKYYRHKWYMHAIKERKCHFGSDTIWAFESSGLSPESDDFKNYKMMKAQFDDLRLLRRAEKIAGLELTMLDDSAFPAHETVEIWEEEDW